MQRAQLLLLLVLCTLVAGLHISDLSLQAQQSLTVLAEDGRYELAVVSVNDRQMVPLSDLAKTFALNVREDTLADGLTVTHRDRVVVLTATQGLASVDGRVVSLPSPPVRTSRGWQVPIEFLSRVLGLVIDTPIELRRRSGLVIVGNLHVPEIEVKYTVGRGQAQIAFEMARPAPYTIEEGPRHLFVKFDADALDVSLPRTSPDSLVASIQLGDEPTWLAIELGSEYASFQSSLLTGSGMSRLLVDVFSAAATAAIARANEPATATEGSVSVIDEGVTPLQELRTPVTVGTIMIDPGHGGDDHGVVGPNGILEKDVTLQVAQRLRRAIESRLGLRVAMTRDGDTMVRLDERAAIANNSKADLFISLHANASLRPEPSGAEVYYLSLARGGDEPRREGSRNRMVPLLGGGTRNIEVLSWEMAQVGHIDRSAMLAAIVNAELRRQVEVRAREAQRAPFRVLVGANMPAVLVELGFLSNPTQERQLTSTPFQEALAEGLFQSVVDFRARAEQQPTTTPGSNGAPREQP